MSSLDEVKLVMKRIASIEGVGEHLCFFGGSIPYIHFNEQSNREHSDIDVLVEEECMGIIRQIAQQSDHYHPELDSINLGLEGDYGLKIFIGGVYVEFEPMIIKDGVFIRKSFSPNKKLAGMEQIPFSKLDDLIISTTIDGVKTFCESMEMIKVSKEQYLREKDVKDIEFIDSHGIDAEKYARVKRAMAALKTDVVEYTDYIM